MDGVVVKQFIDFFQDFLNLCQSDDWPNEVTSKTDIKNAFLTSQHVEKCFEKLQRKHVLSDILSIIINEEDNCSNFIKNCLSDPPKCILKKIICSKVKVSLMDIGFRVFLEVFTECKLESCLTDLIIQAAAQETLLKNVNEIPKQKVLHFKTNIFLSEIDVSDNPKEFILGMINDCDQCTVELLVLSLINKSYKFTRAITAVTEAFTSVMTSKSHIYQQFWKCLLNVEDVFFIAMCMKHPGILKLVAKGLIDCSKLLREHMSADLFYINLTYSELSAIAQKLCRNNDLKEYFFSYILECNYDMDFWKNMLM